MGILTWILLGVIILVAIGLGVGVFFTGLFRGAEIVSENPAIQNATQETKEFVDDRVDVDVDNAVIIVTTDKATYETDDSVQITVKNTGTEKVTFPNAALGLRVKNVETGQSYELMSAQVLTDLDSGESTTLTWQDDSAPAGKYEAEVRTTDGSSTKVTFELK